MADSKHGTAAANSGESADHDPEFKGWLYKWTNYLKGYQKRWFVLANGWLSYYRSQAEMAHTCRGTISLHNAFIHTEDSCNFVISNGGTQTFHLKASNEVERQRWVTALELAKARAIRVIDSEEEDCESDVSGLPDKQELQNVLRQLNSKLEDLETCYDLIGKHGVALQHALESVPQLQDMSGAGTADAQAKMKTVKERSTLFKITSNAMINACRDYLQLAQTQGRKWQRALLHEHGQRVRLEDMVEQLARQHSHLENAARRETVMFSKSPPPNQQVGGERSSQVMQKLSIVSSESDDEFHDALDETRGDGENFFEVTMPSRKSHAHQRTPSNVSTASVGSEGAGAGDESSGSESERTSHRARDDVVRVRPKKKDKNSNRKGLADNGALLSGVNEDSSVAVVSTGTPKVRRKRRARIADRPNMTLNLWSIMKNCIGKELSKIPMPVNFNEPISMLQRLTEEFEYAELLHRAAACKDPCEQMIYIAAFTVSAYSTTELRTSKPFNPLLGETYECDRTDDLGWKAIAEQVSHHPPTAAQYAESKEWILYQEFTMSSKFRGKYLQVTPLGIAHLEFKKQDKHYTWRKVTSTVHNFIVGKLWIDNSGEMDIVEHKNKITCRLTYKPYSYFSREQPRKVTGVVTDSGGNAKWVLSGTWDRHMEGAKVDNCTVTPKGKPVLETGPSKVLWKRRAPPVCSEKVYNFTQLTMELNEMEDDVCPTDSRFRPDQRLMENTHWNEANECKIKLEEKQRAVRRQREADTQKAAAEGRPYHPYEPMWFKKEKDEYTGSLVHKFKGNYWQCKSKQIWPINLPDIFY